MLTAGTVLSAYTHCLIELLQYPLGVVVSHLHMRKWGLTQVSILSQGHMAAIVDYLKFKLSSTLGQAPGPDCSPAAQGICQNFQFSYSQPHCRN